MALSASNSSLRPQVWYKDLMADVMRDLYFMKSGLMGTGDNNIVQIKTDLMKEPGNTVNFGLTYRLSGNGVTGDNELEGNEEELNAYQEAVIIDQIRFAVRLTGKMDEKSNAYNMRMDAKEKLKIRMKEFIERQIFLKLGGVTNTTINDVNGTVVGGRAVWSNTPDYIPDATETAGYGSRYLCADFASGTTSLATTDLITPQLISRVKTKAKLATPKIQPLDIDGKSYYVMFIHPWQAYDLKNNATFAQAMREAEVRGKENPIFSGALGIWDGVVLIEHEFVPFLDVSVAGNSFRGAATGTDCAVDAFRAILCGRQAAGFAQASNQNGWIEKSFDYDNQAGFAVSLIGGIQKLMFNSLEYGCVALDTYATPLV